VRNEALSKRRQKYYIERSRVSTIAAEISWSGALPIKSSLPTLLRPALTFEGLPLLLRPFSHAHVYGTASDHIQNLKSHYVSIWRIFDLVVGVLTNPAFLVRACVFTWREAFSSGLEIVSSALAASESSLMELNAPNLGRQENVAYSSALYKATVEPVLNLQAAMLRGLASITSHWSSILHYNASRHQVTTGSVRSRNPRLFANVDGQDLLVSYVEGENAGRALLSRVRMGAHLSEGYVGHIEGVHCTKLRPKFETDMDPCEFILMITFERLILLNGQYNGFFCDVIWEASFVELVYVESKDVADVPSHTLVLLWFLKNNCLHSREERQANALTSDATGIDSLSHKEMFVSKAFAPFLFAKLRAIDPYIMNGHQEHLGQ